METYHGYACFADQLSEFGDIGKQLGIFHNVGSFQCMLIVLWGNCS